jgi:hypothetical protein
MIIFNILEILLLGLKVTLRSPRVSPVGRHLLQYFGNEHNLLLLIAKNFEPGTA